MYKYIEFCAGGGGMRAGLDAAGWHCILAIDNDPDAVAVHELAHGQALQADVTNLSTRDLPEACVWVAGFPCQPFSTSGNRLGFEHRAGNVFEHLARLMEKRRPPIILLENVEGLLLNKSGHTITVILSKLNALGYSVDWLLIDLSWFSVPQSRPRLFMVAQQAHTQKTNGPKNAHGMKKAMREIQNNCFSNLLKSRGIAVHPRFQGRLAETEKHLRPIVGKPRPVGSSLFGNLGSAMGGKFVSFNISSPLQLRHPKQALGGLVAPNFRFQHEVRSCRFYARGGPTKLYLRNEPISHCIGTSLGGAPLYAVQMPFVEKAADRAAFLEFSNWHRDQDGVLVMRLRPDRAVLLFGPHTKKLQNALTNWTAGDTRKYRVVGNMVAPVCAKAVAELINQQSSLKK